MLRRTIIATVVWGLFLLLTCLVFIAVVGTGGCAHEKHIAKPPVRVEREPEAVPVPVATPPPVAPADGPLCVTIGRDYQWTACFFNFDRSEIREDQRGTVERHAATLLGGGGSVLLQGNCDERGTVEYNLALGERRALAVAKALKAAGVPVAKIAVVSFGKEKATGHDDAGWAADRRVDFKVKE